MCKVCDDFLVCFPGAVEFMVSSGMERIDIYPEHDTAEPDLRHILLDGLLPRVIGQRGRLVLHASCVEVEGIGGIAFVGKSGRGKSTLAASFIRDGARLVADDCLAVRAGPDGVEALSSYPGSRLWGDSAIEMFEGSEVSNVTPVTTWSHKARVELHTGGREVTPTNLRAVFLVEAPNDDAESPEISIEPVVGAETVITLIRSAFLLDNRDPVALASQFEAASGVLDSLGVLHRLTFPREYDLLPDVRSAIVKTVENLAKTEPVDL